MDEGHLSRVFPLFERVRRALPADLPVFLVGGAVRDAVLGRGLHDLDLLVQAGALRVGRRLADALGGAYYPLDDQRDIARVIWEPEGGERLVIDVAGMRGGGLEADLQARDFTINAMAVDVRSPDVLIDPLGGWQDLRLKILRPCASGSFDDDPLRVLRAVRLALAFELQLLPETRSALRAAVPRLASASPERLRDELFRLLEGKRPHLAVRFLKIFGVLPFVLPELEALQGVQQSLPHIADVWEHTLGVVQRLSQVLDLLAVEYPAEGAGSLAAGLLTLRLGRYREQVGQHVSTGLSSGRSLRGLYMLAALYHDAGKPLTRQEEPGGRVRFFDHDQVGAQLAHRRAAALRLSSLEADRLETIVRHHMRPMLLANSGEPPTRRAVYRFFRDTGPAGVDICLLSAADVWATYAHTLEQHTWRRHLDTLRTLLEAWWEQNEQVVAPPALISGHDLMDTLALSPGPQVGRLLDAVREAQAAGQVRTRDEALALVRELSRADLTALD